MSIVLASASETTQKNAVADWVKVFPKQAAETYTGSVNFMKQLTVVAASTITYIRNMFPGENYGMETFGGMKLMILKKNCEDEIAQFVSTALLQAFEAFEKKYLHQLAICYYSGECCPGNLVEYYVFEYSYSDDGVSMNVLSKSRRGNEPVNAQKCTFQSVREQTMRMMRSLMLTLETCVNTPLSSGWTDISIRLYYNDDAPAGYQAPGFISPLEPRDHLAATSSGAGTRHNLGTVQTQYHKLTAAIFTKDLPDSNPTQNTSELMENEMDFEDVLKEAPRGAQTPVPPAPAAPSVLRCPCNMDDIDDTCDILICKYCGCGGHSACYGVRGGGGAGVTRAGHCCDRCADAAVARRPTDDTLRKVRPNQRASLCIYRRTLWECNGRGEVSAAALAHRLRLSQPNACKIIKLLRSSGVLVTGDHDDLISPRKVIREQLELVMDKYFHKETIVEQLCTETTPADDEVDPFEVIERSLKSTTTLGQIIKPTPPKEIDENLTLQQYKEAILSNEKADKELPLSGNHNPVKGIDKIGKKTTKRKIDEDKKTRTAVKTRRNRVASK